MVSLFVAITDRSWFDLLSANRPDEVNFWQPSGARTFKAVSVGELFLFKLHAPGHDAPGDDVTVDPNASVSLFQDVCRQVEATQPRK